MLVLGRKPGERIRIGDEVVVRVIGVAGGQVRLGIEAPARVSVHREEIYERVASANQTAAKSPMDDTHQLTLDHSRFGRIDAPEPATIRCEGLPGFPEARRLLVVDHDRASDFAWLVCFEIPDLALVVTDPRRFFVDYEPQPHRSDLRAIEATPETPVDILAIANVTDRGTSLNLAAPILVNGEAGLAVQAILADGAYPTRAALLTNGGLSGAAQIESKPQR